MSAKRRTVGDSIEVPERGVVVRPDGGESIVTGGSYVLDVPGKFLVDGAEVNVKAADDQ